MPLSRFSVEANSADMQRVYTALSGIRKGAERAINSALNKTVSKAQTRIVDDIYKELNLTKKVIKRFVIPYRSTFSTLRAFVHVTGEPISFKNYGAKVLVRGGISVKVRRWKGTEKFPWMFWAIMDSGHQGVWQRATWTEQRVEKADNLWGITTLPIEEAYGPSIVNVFHNQTEEPVTIDMSDYLQEQLLHETDRVLSGIGYK